MTSRSEQEGGAEKATHTTTIKPDFLPYYQMVAQRMQLVGMPVLVGSEEMWTDGNLRVLLTAPTAKDLSRFNRVAHELEGITALLQRGPATQEEIDGAVRKRLDALFPPPGQSGNE